MNKRSLILIASLILIIGAFSLWIKGIVPFWTFVISFIVVRAIIPKTASDPYNAEDVINPENPRFWK